METTRAHLHVFSFIFLKGEKVRKTYWAVLWPKLDILSTGSSKHTGPQHREKSWWAFPKFCPADPWRRSQGCTAGWLGGLQAPGPSPLASSVMLGNQQGHVTVGHDLHWGTQRLLSSRTKLRMWFSKAWASPTYISINKQLSKWGPGVLK